MGSLFRELRKKEKQQRESQKLNEYTPREVAHSIAIDWLRAAYEGKSGDLDSFNLTPGALRNSKRQIAKLHNKLLEQSGLDGLPISVEE